MTYDGIEELAQFHASEELGFPLLGDENGQHVSAFGVLNEEYSPGDGAYGIPHPGVFHLAPDGTVMAKFAVPGYRARPPMEEIHEAVREQLEAGE